MQVEKSLFDHLRNLYPIFEAAKLCAGLELKARKCVIIPVHRSFSMHVSSIARDRLRRVVPHWGNFQVSDAAKYLGIYVGPNAGSKQWIEQQDKWLSRTCKIASLGAAVADSVALYRQRGITVLSYLAQFFPLPRLLIAKEASVLNRLLRLPGQALRRQDFFSLEAFGGPNVPSVQALSFAAMLRFAAKTTRTWPTNLEKLVATAEGELPLLHFVNGSLSPSFWKEPPIVLNLFNIGLDYSSHKGFFIEKPVRSLTLFSLNKNIRCGQIFQNCGQHIQSCLSGTSDIGQLSASFLATNLNLQPP